MSRKYSRRAFLGMLGLGGLAAIYSSIPKPVSTGIEGFAPQEIERFRPNTLFIDVPPDVSASDFISDIELPESDELWDYHDNMVDLATEYFEGISSHGEITLTSWHEIVKLQGSPPERPSLVSVLPMITPPEFTPRDDNGIEASFTIDINRVNEAVRAFPHRVINMSLQLGESKVAYGFEEPAQTPRHIVLERNSSDDTISYFYINANDLPIDGVSFYEVPFVREDGVSVLAAQFTPTDGEFTTVPGLTQQEYLEQMQAFEQDPGNIIVHDDPQVIITEALNPALAEQNLREIIRLCNKNPERLFVMSAGNINSFFYEIRKGLEEEGIWPDNIIICGVNLPDRYAPIQDGADILVGPEVSGGRYISGSSEAAAVVSAVTTAIYHISPELSPAQVRDLILNDDQLSSNRI